MKPEKRAGKKLTVPVKLDSQTGFSSCCSKIYIVSFGHIMLLKLSQKIVSVSDCGWDEG